MNCVLSRVELAAHAQISKQDLGLISVRSPAWSLLVLGLLVIVDRRWFGWSFGSCAWLFCLCWRGESVFCSPLVPFHGSPQMPFSFGWWPLTPGSTVKRKGRGRAFNQEPLVHWCVLFMAFFLLLGICQKRSVGITMDHKAPSTYRILVLKCKNTSIIPGSENIHFQVRKQLNFESTQLQEVN